MVSGAQDLVMEVSRHSSLETAFGPDDWPVVNGGAYQDFLVIDGCDGCALVGDGMLFGKGGRPPHGFDWYYLFDQHKLKFTRPKFVTVYNCTRFTMRGITLLDAPQFNVALNAVKGAEIAGVNITSTWYIDPKTKQAKEPHNTDGIDPGMGSQDIHVHDVFIHNGDDSVAVKPGSLGACTKNILVENSRFEKGHGCSIGSVGEGCVENVVFRNITMVGEMFGCRVKTYSSKPGHVRNITWADIRMQDTSACLTVNANYKPLPPHPTSFIEVSQLTFRNIKGSRCGQPPQFICPAQSPCREVSLSDISLDGGKMSCANAYGVASGKVVPHSCLKTDFSDTLQAQVVV
eukprot:TRINITY_DN20757_c0_g1_i1.p1 TRINITY_DN20757_c0_g1~~TRINITY_DN20757_c0_g1_i1.p1  ORF type:complete len:346 (-),score=34.69 TRINITY_DN20757_c0_g1_i1:145-1182(-)